MKEYIASNPFLSTIMSWIFVGISLVTILYILQIVAAVGAIVVSWIAIEKRYFKKNERS